LLRAAASKQQMPKIELVFLAPAVRVSLFADALTTGGPLISSFRSFTMSDALERADPVLGAGNGFIYPSSLLYLVSGLFEETKSEAEVDAAILGMQRFFPAGDAAAWITDTVERTALVKVATFLGAQPNRVVYAKINGGPGFWTEAFSHTGFNEEQHTLESVATFLT
jgi:hypothetical protein